MLSSETQILEETTQLGLRLSDPIVQQPIIAEAVKGIKGPIGSFDPRRGNKALMLEVRESGRIPEGFFTDCAIFDENAAAAVEQKRLRRETPLAMRVTRMLGEELDRESDDATEKYISWRLTDLLVRRAYQQATVVEAAKQYFQKKRAGELTDEEALYLKEQLNRAQDEMYPALDPMIAIMALDVVKNGYTSTERAMSDELRSEWHRFLHDNYDPVFEQVYANHPPEQVPIIGAHLRDMTEDFMRISGLPMAEHASDTNRWKCVYDDSASGFRVEVGNKTVVCGKREKPLDNLAFEKLMLHEIIIHAWRAENGSRTGFAAFQMGLPGSIGPEEGLGLLVESLWSGEDPYALSREHFRYVALSYASGVYDGKLHSEQGTYDFTKELMEDAGFGNDSAELYRHVMRVYRGMPDDCRMRSNALYLDGKIGMMRDLQARFDEGESIEDAFSQLQAGRTNPADGEHTELLAAVRK